MTLIVNPACFKSKAALKGWLDAGTFVEDPSFVKPWGMSSTLLPIGFKDVVTNHPLRSKFATIERTATGWKVS